jgi:hypothetical protein
MVANPQALTLVLLALVPVGLLVPLAICRFYLGPKARSGEQ